MQRIIDHSYRPALIQQRYVEEIPHTTRLCSTMYRSHRLLVPIFLHMDDNARPCAAAKVTDHLNMMESGS